jgi:hypothetical protein
LAVPFISEKRGDWVSCWFETSKNADFCRVVSFDGRLIFEGAYLPFPEQSPIHESELSIDAKKMNLAKEQVTVQATNPEAPDPGPNSVPIVYLRDGSVLIPAESYEQGKKRMLELQKYDNPLAPAAKPAMN